MLSSTHNYVVIHVYSEKGDIEIFYFKKRKKNSTPIPIKEILFHKLVNVLNISYFSILECITSQLHLSTGSSWTSSFGSWFRYVTTNYYEVISTHGYVYSKHRQVIKVCRWFSAEYWYYACFLHQTNHVSHDIAEIWLKAVLSINNLYHAEHRKCTGIYKNIMEQWISASSFWMITKKCFEIITIHKIFNILIKLFVQSLSILITQYNDRQTIYLWKHARNKHI